MNRTNAEKLQNDLEKARNDLGTTNFKIQEASRRVTSHARDSSEARRQANSSFYGLADWHAKASWNKKVKRLEKEAAKLAKNLQDLVKNRQDLEQNIKRLEEELIEINTFRSPIAGINLKEKEE